MQSAVSGEFLQEPCGPCSRPQTGLHKDASNKLSALAFMGVAMGSYKYKILVGCVRGCYFVYGIQYTMGM